MYLYITVCLHLYEENWLPCIPTLSPNDLICPRKLYTNKQTCRCTMTSCYFLTCGHIPLDRNLHLSHLCCSSCDATLLKTLLLQWERGFNAFVCFVSLSFWLIHPITGRTKNDRVSRDSRRQNKSALCLATNKWLKYSESLEEWNWKKKEECFIHASPALIVLNRNTWFDLIVNYLYKEYLLEALIVYWVC